MSDDAFSDLFRSPLDPEPGEQRTPWFEWPGFGFGVTLALAAVTLVAVFSGDASSSESSSVPPPTTTVSGDPSDPAAAYPPGYVEVSPGIGLKPEWVYPVEERRIVVLSTSVRSDIPAIDTPLFAGGLWAAEADGTVVVFDAEIRNPQALGMIGIAFADLPAGPIDALTIRPVTSETTATDQATIELAGLPIARDEQLRFALESDVALVIDSIALGLEAGTIDWHLEGIDVRAIVSATLTFPEADPPGTPEPRVMVSEHLAPPYPFQRPSKPTPVPTSGGRDVVRLVGDSFVDPGSLTIAELELEILWQRYADEVVEIPVGLG